MKKKSDYFYYTTNPYSFSIILFNKPISSTSFLFWMPVSQSLIDLRIGTKIVEKINLGGKTTYEEKYQEYLQNDFKEELGIN